MQHEPTQLGSPVDQLIDVYVALTIANDLLLIDVLLQLQTQRGVDHFKPSQCQTVFISGGWGGAVVVAAGQKSTMLVLIDGQLTLSSFLNGK